MANENAYEPIIQTLYLFFIFIFFIYLPNNNYKNIEKEEKRIGEET